MIELDVNFVKYVESKKGILDIYPYKMLKI